MGAVANGGARAPDERIFGLPRRLVLGAGIVWLVLAAIAWTALIIEETGEPDEFRAPLEDRSPPPRQAQPPVATTPASPPPQPASGTRISLVTVGVAVIQAAGAAGEDPALCAPLNPTGIGPWTCTYREPLHGSIRPAQIDVREDGSYSVTVTDGRGTQRAYPDLCCLRVGPP
jgi:hypothetical protein